MAKITVLLFTMLIFGAAMVRVYGGDIYVYRHGGVNVPANTGYTSQQPVNNYNNQNIPLPPGDHVSYQQPNRNPGDYVSYQQPNINPPINNDNFQPENTSSLKDHIVNTVLTNIRNRIQVRGSGNVVSVNNVNFARTY